MAAALLVLPVLGAAPFSHSANAAEPLTFKARIGVFYAGFLVYSGRLDGEIGEGRYAVVYSAETRGLLRLIVSMETRNEVVGLLRNGGFQATTYRDRVRWRRKRTAVEVGFGPEGAVRTVATPSFASRNRRPIPIAVSRGALDPLTTLVSGMAIPGNKKPCTWRHRVYDGRRLVRLEFTNLGKERLLNDGLTFYKGPAVKCRIRFVQLADTRRKPAKAQKKKGGGDPNVATFWLARFKRPDMWLPVRALGWSDVGPVRAGLTNFKVRKPSLARRN